MSILNLIVPLSCFLLANASISRVNVKRGEQYLVNEGVGAKSLQRDIKSGHQIMKFDGENSGKFVADTGSVVESDNYKLFTNGSVLIKAIGAEDAGVYQKYPNPMIIENHVGKAPPILMINVI